MKWHLTQAAPGQPEIDVREDIEGLFRTFSLMREIAREPGSHLREISPGVWVESKIRSTTGEVDASEPKSTIEDV